MSLGPEGFSEVGNALPIRYLRMACGCAGFLRLFVLFLVSCGGNGACIWVFSLMFCIASLGKALV